MKLNINTYEYSTRGKVFSLVNALGRATEHELVLLSIACSKGQYTKLSSDKVAAFDLLNTIVEKHYE